MSETLRIQIVESFYTGSHQFWADSFKKYSAHLVDLNTLPGRHWKWRMSAGCINLAQTVRNFPKPDLFILSSLVDLCGFKALLPADFAHIPLVYFMHENQLVYPENQSLDWDRQYGLIQFKSALAADRVVFNSEFHRRTFLEALPSFLKAFPDKRNLGLLSSIQAKSDVLYLGIEPPTADRHKGGVPHVLWNHRWEHDKNPAGLLRILSRLLEKGLQFELSLCGEQFGTIPPVFDQFLSNAGQTVIHKGFLPRTEYEDILGRAHILPVTSLQEYFGLSVLEAIAHGVIPLLPRRLVYPELYGTFDHLFYTTESELEQKLGNLISNFGEVEIPDVSAFYWPHLIHGYDRYFRDLITE